MGSHVSWTKRISALEIRAISERFQRDVAADGIII